VQTNYVIIVAGGTGSRMQSQIPKQFIEINGQPIIIKTINCFFNFDKNIQIIICVHKEYKNYLNELLIKHKLQHHITITLGGETRFNSVKNGLQLINNNKAVVGIHDAARPFVSVKTIQNCYTMASQKGNAIPAITINESIREVNANQNKAVNRSNYKIIQTPQCFKVELIKKAFEQAYNPIFTDDATVLESMGNSINLVEGNVENIKITTPQDLVMAKSLV
jgi:2-C-methyl-D-erythritol 4-phosphate cytidylyltransferase